LTGNQEETSFFGESQAFFGQPGSNPPGGFFILRKRARKHMRKLAGILGILLLLGCEEDLTERGNLEENAGIVGTWVEVGTEGEVKTLERSENLDPENYGFIVKNDGSFLERKNAGWCGTPPISYANFDGSWTALSDSLLEITVGYWGGTMNYQIRVVNLEEDQLEIRYLYADAMTESR
jgi:hypothetical protein